MRFREVNIRVQTDEYEEKLFQEHEFENKRKLSANMSTYSIPFLVVTHIVRKANPYLRNTDTLGWILDNTRLMHIVFIFVIMVVCVAADPKWPRFRSLLQAYNVHFFNMLAIWRVFWEFLVLGAMEVQIGYIPDFNRCDKEHQLGLCPSPLWSLASTNLRIVFYYVFNMLLGLPLRDCIRLWLFHSTILFLMLIPWGPFADYVVSSPDYWSLELGIGPIMCLVHLLVSLALCKQNEMERRVSFKNAYMIDQYKEIGKLVLGTMMPERLSGDVVGTTRFPLPKLIIEDFPCVTIMFCSFNQTDMCTVASADTFIQLLAKSIDTFDRIVQEHHLHKVTQVGLDYIVTSPCVRQGPVSGNLASEEEWRSEATQLVKVAAILVKEGNALRLDGNENDCLHLRAGLHSGPIIGAMVGKKRRCYRLFGDTLSTAARLVEETQCGQVRVTEATKRLTEHDPLLEFEPFDIKGKGLTQTYMVIVSGDGLHSHDIPTISNVGCHPCHLNVTTNWNSTELLTRALESTASPLTKSAGEFTLDVIDEIVDNNPAVSSPKSPKSEPGSPFSWITAGNAFSWPSFTARYTSAFTSLLTSQDSPHHRVIHRYSGTFIDQYLENQFHEDGTKNEVGRLKVCLVTMIVSHAIFFGAMYLVVDYASPLESWGVLSMGIFVVTSFMGIYLTLALAGVNFTLNLWRMILVISTVGTVSMIALCSSVFSWLGVSLTIVACHNHERPPLSLLFSTIVSILAACVAIKSKGSEFSTISAQLYLAVFLGLGLAFYRLLHCRSVRLSWLITKNLIEESEQLDMILDDLIPSVEGQQFLRTRFAQMALRTVTPSEGGTMPTGVCNLDNPTRACVLFSGFVGFAETCEKLQPHDIVVLIHNLRWIFDCTLEQHISDRCRNPVSRMPYVWKPQPFTIDTFRDSYVVVSKFPEDSKQEFFYRSVLDLLMLAKRIMTAFIDYSMIEAPTSFNFDPGMIKMSMGLGVGNLPSGVIGCMQPLYFVYGEAVDIAANVQSQSSPTCLRFCKSTRQLLSAVCEEESIFRLLPSAQSSHRYLDMQSVQGLASSFT